jgi:hypothetical protein
MTSIPAPFPYQGKGNTSLTGEVERSSGEVKKLEV